MNIHPIIHKLQKQTNFWNKYGCPLLPSNIITSFMHEKTRVHSGLYLQNQELLRNIVYGNITSDGSYLYIYHRKFGLFKIGTGYHNTVQGKMYASNSDFCEQFLDILSPPGLRSDAVSKGLGNTLITNVKKYAQRYYGGGNSNYSQYSRHYPTTTAAKDVLETSLCFFNNVLYFRSREMLDYFMITIDTQTLVPQKDSSIDIHCMLYFYCISFHVCMICFPFFLYFVYDFFSCLFVSHV